MPSNSLATTPPGSPAPAASGSPLVDEQDPLTLVAFVGGTTWPQASVAEPLAQTHEQFGGGAGAAVLFAVFAHVAAGFREAVEEHPGAARSVVDGALAGGVGGGGGRARTTAPAAPRAVGGDGDRRVRPTAPAAGSAPRARRLPARAPPGPDRGAATGGRCRNRQASA